MGMQDLRERDGPRPFFGGTGAVDLSVLTRRMRRVVRPAEPVIGLEGTERGGLHTAVRERE